MNEIDELFEALHNKEIARLKKENEELNDILKEVKAELGTFEDDKRHSEAWVSRKQKEVSNSSGESPCGD